MNEFSGTKLVQNRHLLLKSLCKVKKVSNHGFLF